MKRRNFLQLLGIAPLALAVLAAEEPTPKAVEVLTRPTGLMLEKGFVAIGNEVFLLDNWQGYPTPGPYPDDWTRIHTQEWFPLGTKRMVYDDTNQGWATLIYLYYNNPPSGTISRYRTKRLCCMDLRKRNRKTGKWCCATNVIAKEQLLLPLAVHLGTPMIDSTYAWFWCGGVCPVDSISMLGRKQEELVSSLAERRMCEDVRMYETWKREEGK